MNLTLNEWVQIKTIVEKVLLFLKLWNQDNRGDLKQLRFVFRKLSIVSFISNKYLEDIYRWGGNHDVHALLSQFPQHSIQYQRIRHHDVDANGCVVAGLEFELVAIRIVCVRWTNKIEIELMTLAKVCFLPFDYLKLGDRRLENCWPGCRCDVSVRPVNDSIDGCLDPMSCNSNTYAFNSRQIWSKKYIRFKLAMKQL